jgi:hypothetical protein
MSPHPTRTLRPWAIALVLAGSLAAAQADTSVGLSVNVGGPVYSALPLGATFVQVGGTRYGRHGSLWYRPWGPRWVAVAAPVVVVPAARAAVVTEAAGAYIPSQPDPVITPRQGQSTEQTELDRQDCNRWATTQPAALADAGVFQRAVAACMDARGYTVK